jgi:hypothetical protein
MMGLIVVYTTQSLEDRAGEFKLHVHHMVYPTFHVGAGYFGHGPMEITALDS